MEKLELVNRFTNNRKVSIVTAAVIIILVILDLLTTRQILYFGNTSEIVLFILTAGIGYGIGSWILLGFTKHITKDLRSKSLLINIMQLAVTIIQFSLLGILSYILYNNLANCYGYFSLCSGTRFLTSSANATASITATIIMGIISFKLFSWYKLDKKNFILLFFGLAAAALAISIAGDAFDKLYLVLVVQEKSPLGAVPQSSFIYKTFEQYHGEIEYKVVNPHTTTLYVVPTPKLDLYNQIIYWTSDAPYILTWAGTFMLLRYYYQRRMGKLNFTFWIMLAVPLILYLIGSGLIFSLPSDIPYRFYFRLVFRAGTIGSSILFGLAFYITTRNLSSVKVKDYLAIAAIGITTIGIANEVSSLQQTYGVAAHSLVLLSSYLFAVGLYSSAVSISQDSSLRKSIRNSAIEVSKLVDILGTPHMEEEIGNRVVSTAKEQRSILLKKTGIEPSLTEYDMKQYVGAVLKEIKVLKNIDEILKKGKDILESSYEFLVCSKISGLRLVYNNYFNLYEKIMDKHKKGEHNGIKLATTIVDKDAADLVKKFLDIGIQVKHVNNMPPIDFAVSDKEMIATLERFEEPEEMVKSLLVSNEQAYVSHFAFIFNELWKDAIDAKERILAIEKGIEPEFFEVINDHKKASKVFVDLAKSVKQEALLLLPNDKAIVRADRMGIIDYLIKASQENNAAVKIICPLSKENSDVIKKVSDTAPHIRILDGNISSTGMFIVDNAKFFRAELREPKAENFLEAIGFTTYSNSRRSVESFRSIFELLWNEHLLNEELKNTETMQKEFINVAAHELRSPIQPILGLSDTLLSKKEIDTKQYRELLQVINRNAKRLRRLTEDILDVTRIESQTLNFKRSHFNLKEVILNTITDFKTQIKSEEGKDNKVNLHFISAQDNVENIFIYGDQGRITQVIYNLLNNAIKFTHEGSITIKMKKIEKDNNITSNYDRQEQIVVVSIQDTGIGIDPTIEGKLFNKFATKSEKGIGLGLYISRGIIEAHNGKIWAENNADGRGATFHFSLPLSANH